MMPSEDRRVQSAVADSGLQVHEQWDVIFREGTDPRVTVWGCHKKMGESIGVVTQGTLVIRNAVGEFTEEYTRFQKQMGMDDPYIRSMVSKEN